MQGAPDSRCKMSG